MERNGERGSVIILIIIFCALFGALSYAVTQSMRVGTNTGDKEKVTLTASELINWGNQARTFVANAMAMDGVKENEFTFQNGTVAPTSICARVECDVYNGKNNYNLTTQTNGINLLTAPVDNYFDPEFIGHPHFSPGGYNPKMETGWASVVRILGVGNDTKGDVVFGVGFVSEAVCRRINEMLGLTDTYPLDPYVSTGYTVSSASSPVPEPGAGSDIGDTDTELKGKRAFCVRDGQYSNKSAHFLTVLIAR